MPEWFLWILVDDIWRLGQCAQGGSPLPAPWIMTNSVITTSAYFSLRVPFYLLSFSIFATSTYFQSLFEKLQPKEAHRTQPASTFRWAPLWEQIWNSKVNSSWGQSQCPCSHSAGGPRCVPRVSCQFQRGVNTIWKSTFQASPALYAITMFGRLPFRLTSFEVSFPLMESARH